MTSKGKLAKERYYKKLQNLYYNTFMSFVARMTDNWTNQINQTFILNNSRRIKNFSIPLVTDTQTAGHFAL